MTSHEELWEAQRIIGKHWKKGPSPEQTKLLGFARDTLKFISETGQRHPFHDARASLSTLGFAQEPPAPATLLSRTEVYFTRLLQEAMPVEEQELIQVIIDALRFIAATGQQAALEDYIQHLEAGAPPYVVAAFNTQKDAEDWLHAHPEPPDFAHILVAGEYRSVSYDRRNGTRSLPNDHALEYYLSELSREEPPVAVASFSTRSEAETWLKAQRDLARRAWVLVGDEFYLAAHYPHIHCRVLFPLSIAEGFDMEM